MSFQQIIGQDRPIQRLKKYLASGNFPGAYLFTGPTGVGKGLAALNFAKAINCSTPAADACDECASCVKIEKNIHPDVHIIDASENSESHDIKIEDVRLLQGEAALRPYEARKKVFIVNDAHNLTADAANAFLKTLEEPPKNSLIILCTSKPGLLFKTIVSRCQVISFFPLIRSELEAKLREGLGLDNNTIHFLSYFCEGRIGEALRLKDKDALADKNRVIDEFIFSSSSVKERASKPDRDYLRYCLRVLSGWLRDVYLIKSGAAAEGVINIDRKDDLSKFKDRYSYDDLGRKLKVVSESLNYAEQNINVKLLMANLKTILRG